jgi:hypothetical protein
VRWRPREPPWRPPPRAGARRFTADGYHRMAEAGILGEDERVELLDGAVLEMRPVGDRHVGAVGRCGEAFAPVWVAGRLTLHASTRGIPCGSTTTTSRGPTSRSRGRGWRPRRGLERSC